MILKDILQRIVNTGSRNTVNLQPVFIPLDLNALNVSIGSKLENGSNLSLDLNPLRNKIVQYIKRTYTNKIVLSSTSIKVNGVEIEDIQELLSNNTPAIVYLGVTTDARITGILFNKFNSSQSALFHEYLNTEVLKFLNKSYGTKFNSLDTALLFDNTKETTKQINLLSKILNSFSPNSVKINDVVSSNSNTIAIKAKVESLLRTYARTRNVKPRATANVTKTLSSFISKINADIVVLNTNSEKTKRELDKNITNISKSLLEEPIVGKTSFLKSIKNKLISVFQSKKFSDKVKTTTVKVEGKSTSSSLNLNTSSGPNTTFKFPTPRVSISKLENLINRNLHDRIKANMGKGNSKTLLNYRTGRLARSAQVENITIDRQGALTAFFSYMRYPYGTFSKGGRQESPSSRDPVPLIGKSIRELAIAEANTVLKTVVV